VGTPGSASPGILRQSAQMAASKAKGRTAPSVKEIESGRIAAFSAGTTVNSAYAPS
jgi:hypothetical protein